MNFTLISIWSDYNIVHFLILIKFILYHQMIRTLYRPSFSFSFVTNLRRKIEESDPEVYKEILN